MKLKDSQIEQIEQDLKARGITYDPLLDDLLDHICCEVEEQMENGLVFMDAYHLVISTFEKRGFEDLNKETTTLLNYSTMFKNTFIVTGRLLKNNLSYSLIKIVGLSIGIASLLLGFIYMKYETTYDQFHPDAERTYRMGRIIDRGQIITTAFPLVPALRTDFPEYQFTRFFKDRSKTLFRNGETAFFEPGMIWGDKDFLKFFEFPGFIGDKETALREPFSIVLTEQMALKYFRDIPEIGERIEYKWNGKFYPLTITGIIPEWPENMHIQFESILSFKTSLQVFPQDISDGWTMNYCYSYVKLPPSVKESDFTNSFESFVKKHVKDTEKGYETYLGFLQPLTVIHLSPGVLASYTQTMNPIYPRLAFGIGLLILIITSINFITLTVVQFQYRSKEVGIRKAVGATKKQILVQLVFETMIIVSISLLFGLGLVYLFIEPVNNFLSLDLKFMTLLKDSTLLIIPGIIAILTVVTGLYPSYLFSKKDVMQTIEAQSRSRVSFRKVLLTTQFLIAAVLITFTFTLNKQVNYVQGQEPGYQKEQVLYTPYARQIRYDSKPFKTKAEAHPGVEAVALSFYKPTDDMGFTTEIRANENEAVPLTTSSVDEDFFETFGIPIVQGRNFRDSEADQQNAFILNESAVELLELDDPLSAQIKTEFRTGNPTMPVEQKTGQVIGVVKDVHFESLHNEIKPMVFIMKPYWYYYINIRIAANDYPETIKHLENAWSELFPEQPFDFYFLDDEFELQYAKENQLAKGLTAMAVLAILTTCLGLFSYVRFITQQRTKEVGIRKALGAGIFNISQLFTKDFVVAILIANVLAAPISYYVSEQWLQNFAFRIDVTFWPFLLTLVGLAALAVLTVLKELLKIANLNPTSALRYE